MPDLYDRAQERELENTAAAQRAHIERQTPEPAQVHWEGQVICLDCGKSIGPRRLKAKPNAARCVDCQSALEGRNGH